jgi:hypothetical protein
MPGRPSLRWTGHLVGTSSTSELFGWQITTGNTGLVGAGIDRNTLATYSGSSTPSAGTTISLRKITTQLDCSNGGITLDRCWIQPTSGSGNMVGTYNGSSWAPNTVLVTDCELDGSLLSASDAAFSTGADGIVSVVRCYIHDVGLGANLHAWPSGLPSLIKHNYFLVNAGFGDPATTGNHADGFTIRNFDADTNPSRTATVQNNRIDCSAGDNSTGAFFIQASGSDEVHNVTVQGNLFEGEGNQCILERKDSGVVSNVSLINNRMSNTGLGSGYVSGDTWDLQSANYVNDPGQPDNRGAPVSF